MWESLAESSSSLSRTREELPDLRNAIKRMIAGREKLVQMPIAVSMASSLHLDHA
jgi:predicted ester cyclase